LIHWSITIPVGKEYRTTGSTGYNCSRVGGILVVLYAYSTGGQVSTLLHISYIYIHIFI
jgi:hypothetical protein